MSAHRLRASLWQMPTDFLAVLLDGLRILVASARPAGISAAVMFRVARVEAWRRDALAALYGFVSAGPVTPIADGHPA